jgi:hypothetical protein
VWLKLDYVGGPVKSLGLCTEGPADAKVIEHLRDHHNYSATEPAAAQYAFCFIIVIREKARSDWLCFSQFRTCFPGPRKIISDFSDFAREILAACRPALVQGGAD